MNDFAGPFRLTSVRSTLSRGPVSGGFRVAPFVLLVSLLLPSLAKADDLAFIISPKAVAGVTASTKTFASFQNVTVSNSPNNVPRKFLVVASMSMIASNFTVGEFRLYAPGAINEYSPAVKLSVPYQTAASDPTNNSGLSFIFEYSGDSQSRIFHIEHRIGPDAIGTPTFESRDWTLIAVGLTSRLGGAGTALATPLQSDLDFFDSVGNYTGTPPAALASPRTAVVDSTVSPAAGSRGLAITALAHDDIRPTATATATATGHNFAVGDRVLISGIVFNAASPDANIYRWNGFVTLTAADQGAGTFQFPITNPNGDLTPQPVVASSNLRAMLAVDIANTSGNGTTVTATLKAHGFQNGDLVLISGATNNSAFNGFVSVSVGVGQPDTFSYASTATGAPTGNVTAIRYMRKASRLFSTGTTATVDLPAAHGFTDGDRVWVKGAKGDSTTFPYDSDLYNGYFTITVIDGDSFSYTMYGDPTDDDVTDVGSGSTVYVARVARALTPVGGNTLTRSGSTVTGQLSAHGFNVGDRVVVAESGQDEYNGDYEVASIGKAVDGTGSSFAYLSFTSGSSRTVGTARLASVTVTNISQVGTTVTVKTLEPHGLRVGDGAEISGINPGAANEFRYYQGFQRVTSVIDAITFTFTQTLKTGLDAIYWDSVGPGNLDPHKPAARFIPPDSNDGVYLTKPVAGNKSSTQQPLEVEIEIPADTRLLRDVVLAFNASIRQKTATSTSTVNVKSSLSQWRYGVFQLYYQSPTMRAENPERWEKVGQRYTKTTDAIQSAVHTLDEIGMLQIYQRYRVPPTEVGGSGRIWRFRVKAETRHGGDGIWVESGSLVALGTSWADGSFKTLWGTGGGYNKPAQNVQWMDTDDIATNALRTEPFLKVGTESFVGLASTHNWTTKGGGNAGIVIGPGMRNAGWLAYSANQGNDAWGGKLSGGGGVVVLDRLYNGSVGALCFDKGYLGGRMPFMALGGCEAANQSAVGMAINAQYPITGTNPAMPPWEGSLTGQMNGQQGAMNGDIVIFATGSQGPTFASPAGVKAVATGGKTLVSFSTSGEIGTAALRLERLDPANGNYVAVGPGDVPALPPYPAGADYSVEDPGAAVGQTYEYRIVETETNGSTFAHGPYTVTIEPASAPAKAGIRALGDDGLGYSRTSAVPTSGKVTRPPLAERDLPWARSSWKTVIRDEGIYAISLDAANDPQTSRNHRLSDLGQDVAFANDGSGKRLLFYGRPLRNFHTESRPYLLRPGGPTMMKEQNGKAPAAAAQPAAFSQSSHFETDLLPATGWVFDESHDFWFWQTFLAERAAYRNGQFTFETPLRESGGGSATVAVNVYGMTDSPGVDDIQFRVSVNGVAAGTVQLDGNGPSTGTVSFDASLLKDGANTLTLDAILPPGLSRSWWFLDSFDVTYPKRFEARGGKARVRLAGAQKTLTVGGFTKADILVFDVTDPLNPVWVKATAVDGSAGAYSVRFAPNAGSTDFYFAQADQVRTASLQPLVDAGLGSRKDGAQHLVIATYDLLVAAQELSKHRSASGLSSLAIPAEAIWDEFGEGLATPQAVRAFLEHAKANYKPAPSYVALAGKGTYDERNLLGFNDNLIPTWFRKSVWGVVGMDSPYVEGLGMKLGRIPATTGADLLYFVQKTAAHEAAPVSGRVTLLSDNKDAAGDFPNDVLDLASAVPATYTTTVSRLGVQSLAVVRQAAISAFQRGDDVVGWVGHGGTDRFATEGVLVLNDVPALNNAGHLSLLVGATCNVNGFYLAGNGSLGEKLVNRRDGGAIASWAPVGPSYNAASVPVVRTLLPELLSESSEGARLGDVLQKTQELQGGEAATERSLWQLLGDPGALVP